METITVDLLAKKLKNVPQTVLERVNGYVDSLIEPSLISKKPYKLTNEQQNILDSQISADKSTYVDAEELHNTLKKKYAL